MNEEKKPEGAIAPVSSPDVVAGAMTLPITEEQEAAVVAAARAKAKATSGANALIGSIIAGRYRVLGKLGEGGMGTVYRALHTVLEKQVALKVLHGELSHKPELIERFLQEAKAASRIRHENVIDISDFGATDDGHVFFAMELLEGHDLQQELRSASRDGKLLPWARTKKIFLQICAALSAAHARGIVHRDLKPENVYLIDFLGEPDFVKLLDFGIAKVTDVSASDPDRKLTKTGMLFGTPEYMSPEQARGEKVDQRVDVYAMGCILFHLVSNRLPFQAENFMGVLSQHLTQEPPEIAPETFDQIGAPRELAQVIDVALAKDRDERWQSIGEMVTAIHDACGDVLTSEKARPKRVPSVPSPGETTRLRTPSGPFTPQPADANKPTIRAKRISAPPLVPAAPLAAPRQKRETGIPNDDWKGNVALSDAALEHGAHRPQKQKSMALPAIALMGLLGGGVAVAFGLGVFDSKPAAKAAAASDGSGSADVTPPPPPGAPALSLPAKVSLSFSTTPPGANIVELPSNMVVGKTPFKLTVPGSSTARQYKLVLHGYGEQTIELTPNQALIELTATLVKGGAASTTKAEPRRSEHGTSGTPTTTPESSGAVTRPETTPVTTPETTATLPENKPDTPPALEAKPDPGIKPPAEPPPEAKPEAKPPEPPAEPSGDQGTSP